VATSSRANDPRGAGSFEPLQATVVGVAIGVAAGSGAVDEHGGTNQLEPQVSGGVEPSGTGDRQMLAGSRRQYGAATRRVASSPWRTDPN
jgi:hypothetical protein